MSEKTLSTGWKTSVGILSVLVVILGFALAFSGGDTVVQEGFTQEQLDQAASDAFELGKADVPVDGEPSDEPSEEVEERVLSGYLEDELFLETNFGEVYSDRELNLFDGEVEFDDEDYDAEESFETSNLILKSNEEDFEGVTYLTVPEGSLKYLITFESDLDTSLIDEDETLEFNFLGKEVEVSDWNGGDIEFSMGQDHYLDQGDVIDFEGHSVTLDSVFDGKVHVIVDGEQKRISEGDTASFGDIEVYVKEVDFQAYAEGFKQATLVIGEEVTKEVSNGDEYEDDSIWEYVITANSIGLVLSEEFTELDDEFKVLAVDENLCLPNDYVCVQFNGLSEDDSEKISFDLDTRSGNEYVEVKGNFQSGLEDYDRLFINSTGFFDEDLDAISGTITVSDFDSTISLSGSNIVIEDFQVNLDLNVSNVGDDEENYLTNFGIFVEDPEDSSENFDWTIVLPEEKVEGSISLI